MSTLRFLLCISFLSLSIARADTFNWTYTGSKNSGIGTLVTDPTDLGGGTNKVISIAGTFNTLTITGLASTNDFANNDNLVAPGQVPLLDIDGMAFTTPASTWNLFYNAGTYQSAKEGDNSAGDLGVFTLSLVPEASTYVLFGLGVLVTGMIYRRKLRKYKSNE